MKFSAPVDTHVPVSDYGKTFHFAGRLCPNYGANNHGTEREQSEGPSAAVTYCPKVVDGGRALYILFFCASTLANIGPLETEP